MERIGDSVVEDAPTVASRSDRTPRQNQGDSTPPIDDAINTSCGGHCPRMANQTATSPRKTTAPVMACANSDPRSVAMGKSS